MKKHIDHAIKALQETQFDIASLQEDVELLIDVATGKAHHLYSEGLCPAEVEGFDARNSDCPVCCAIARLQGRPLSKNQRKEAVNA